MSKHRTLILTQWTVSIILVWYLLSKIDLASSLRAARNANLWLLLASLGQLAVQPLLGALRWKLIIQRLDGELSFAMALRFFWTGLFFNQALPGAVGGDAVRIWLHWRDGAGRRLAINGVALERMTMVLSLLILVAVMQTWGIVRSESLVATWLPSLILVAAVSGLSILMVSDRLVKRFGQWLPLRAIAYLAVDSRKVLLSPLILTAVALISILAYLNMAVTAWLIALALGLTVSLTDCIVLIPLVVLAAILPISVGGWGVREGAAIVLFGAVGVLPTDALALSVIFGIAGIVMSLPGLAIWIRRGYRRSDLSRAASFANIEAPKS